MSNTTDPPGPAPLPYNTEVDTLLGAITITLVLISVSGNVPALVYFWRTKGKSIPDVMYIAISGVDVMTALVGLPVVGAMMTGRAAGLFAYPALCYPWPLFFYFCLRTSMFMVMLLSVSRTVAITLPFATIPGSGLQLTCIGLLYGVVLSLFDLILLIIGQAEVIYYAPYISCELVPTLAMSDSLMQGVSILLIIQIVAPTVIVLISFIAGMVCLYSYNKTALRAEDATKFRTVSMTIAMFTGLFLLCNTPCFLSQLMYILGGQSVGLEVMVRIRGSVWFTRYGHVMTHYLPTLVNSSANPILYLTRMTKFRTWVRSGFKFPETLATRVSTLHSRLHNTETV